MSITAAPKAIAANGEASTLTITTVDEKSAAGSGTVLVTSTAGSLSGGQELTLANGSATVQFTCDAATDAKCSGLVRITASWSHSMTSYTGSTTVTVGSNDGGAGGGTGGGATGGGGGSMGGGTGGGATGGGGASGGGTGGGATGGGTGGGTVLADGGLVVTAVPSRTRIYLGVNDFSDVTIALRRTDAGPAIPGRDFSVTSSIGGLTDAVDAGAPTPTSPYTFNSGASGLGVARFKDTGSVGMATIQATDVLSGTSRSATVEIASIQQVSWNGMQCRGTACTILGVKNSGNEIGVASFKVTDNLNRPVVGVAVTFSLVNAPGSTVINPLVAYTDATGVAATSISAGPTTGAFTIHAVVIAGTVEGDSPTIGVRGVRPANKSFGINCATLNMAALECANPNCPRAYSIPCTITLKDRFNNPVGTGTSVNLKVEAGQVPVTINTTAYSSMGSNLNEGTGTFNYQTSGGSNALPQDVDPLPAASQGVFMARDPEPNYSTGLVHNPRDGLVSLMAYVSGEEWFSDDNQNGVHDANEQFIDQGEPFVDYNDNGVRDVGEDYLDLAPPDGGSPNGMWDPPNGTWDSNTTIWTETRFLWTSAPKQVLFSNTGFVGGSTLPFSPASCPAGLAKGATQDTFIAAPDVNLNHPQSTTTFSVSHSSTRGTPTLLSTGVLDTLGIGNVRTLVSATDNNAACVAATPICVWKLLFSTWSHGFTGAKLHLAAPAVTDTGVCASDNVTVGATTVSVTAQGVLSGSWQGN